MNSPSPESVAPVVRIHPASRGKRTGLSAPQERRLRVELRRLAPSEPWVDAQLQSVTRLDERGRVVTCRVHDPHVFPPGGEKTGMVRCPVCDVWTPPGAMEHDLCLDHSDHRGWGPSPSAAAIAALQHHNLRLIERELRPESTKALKKEIRLTTKK